MKVFIVLTLTLACVSAATVLDYPVFYKGDATNVENIDGRITNGNSAHDGQFPYQVGLSLESPEGSIWCGGTLIGEKWVLTTAHCTENVNSAKVYLGSTIRTIFKVAYFVTYSEIFQHKEYNPTTFANDLSLIQIPPVTFTKHIQAIKLPAISSDYSTYENEAVIATGWGQTDDYGSVVSSLNYAILQVVSNTECVATYGDAVDTKNTLCVSTTRLISTCKGDFGGPLTLYDRKTLIGVTSFGSPLSCTAESPIGSVRVTSYLEWIRDNTGIFY